MFIFIAGTARSGKSEYAERRALELGRNSQKIYIAAAKIYDSEMLRRVELHQTRRKDMGFLTIERPDGLGELELPENSCVLLESLSIWTANEMFTDSGVNHDAGEKVFRDFITLRDSVRDIVLVSDDIFSDGVSYDSLTEEYIRGLARLHVRLAAIADEVVEIFAGIPLQYSIIT